MQLESNFSNTNIETLTMKTEINPASNQARLATHMRLGRDMHKLKSVYITCTPLAYYCLVDITVLCFLKSMTY